MLKFPRVALFALLPVFLVVTGAALQSCRPASYEILKPGKKKNTTAKTPDNLIPPSSGNVPPNQPIPGTQRQLRKRRHLHQVDVEVQQAGVVP